MQLGYIYFNTEDSDDEDIDSEIEFIHEPKVRFADHVTSYTLSDL